MFFVDEKFFGWLSLILVGGLSLSASGVVRAWDWGARGSDNWMDARNWTGPGGGVVPSADAEARFAEWNTAVLNADAGAVVSLRVAHGASDGGFLSINTNGTLVVNDRMDFGWSKGAPYGCNGKVCVNGGCLTVNGLGIRTYGTGHVLEITGSGNLETMELCMGYAGDDMSETIINIDGGKLIVSEGLWLGRNQDVGVHKLTVKSGLVDADALYIATKRGTSAHVQLSGGVIQTKRFSMGGGGARASMDISNNAKLILKGLNGSRIVNKYIQKGYLTFNGGSDGEVIYDGKDTIVKILGQGKQ